VSRSATVQAKDRLLTLLGKTPPAQQIDTTTKARAFKEAHARAYKYAQSGRSNPAELQTHITALMSFHQNGER
jgi:hypothetical protein